ncbi:hypothetical protein VOLCADRAFT_61926 [Volvox carteri f. nagariensis]|uniref:2-oxoacid dehydrogenase acyltransferase catalytic domain-containing protein n=1 Tax=Volvox carteri f. nagariensis TaxID=3068 RepID=D8TZY6_VOLCA|nr:uncharacterized protein VOLCADRAFT_61926 [Volvox carteri f. nagariensis]EFJ47089.1 hypothetical protein VOLCADRAFT_61926 [Volvox carteri f. nagariensis]|eukprot:XP_002951984.1 hypothetical protein VOLCADRAFT_61926 [Volvox carteri f. nagariensis]
MPATGGTELLVHPYHNIGVAMATPSGLVVPNIKHVERKSVAQLASELQLLQQLAAAGRLPAEALAGGTITISNIGTIGGKYGTPLVTPPTVAIVALGRLQLLPRYPPGTTMSTAATAASPFTYHWGADHRAIDGAALAAFSNSWKALLEHPERLLLHLT